MTDADASRLLPLSRPWVFPRPAARPVRAGTRARAAALGSERWRRRAPRSRPSPARRCRRLAVAGHRLHAGHAPRSACCWAPCSASRWASCSGCRAAPRSWACCPIEVLRPGALGRADPAGDADVRLRRAHGARHRRLRHLLADAGPGAVGGAAGRAAPARSRAACSASRRASAPARSCCRRSCRACSSRCGSAWRWRWWWRSRSRSRPTRTAWATR